MSLDYALSIQLLFHSWKEQCDFKRISHNYAYCYEKLQTVPLSQFLTDQLTLFESGGEIMPNPLLLAPRISIFVYGPIHSISINSKARMWNLDWFFCTDTIRKLTFKVDFFFNKYLEVVEFRRIRFQYFPGTDPYFDWVCHIHLLLRQRFLDTYPAHAIVVPLQKSIPAQK